MPGLIYAGKSVIKYTLFCFNVIFFLIGILIIFQSIMALSSADKQLNEATMGHLKHVAYGGLFIGFCITISSYLGCYGAYSESPVILLIYVVVMSLLLMAQVPVVYAAYSYRSSVEQMMSDNIPNVFRKYTMSPSIKKWVDEVQDKFECCGANNITQPWKELHINPPPSCYVDHEVEGSLHDKACVPIFIKIMRDAFNILGLIALLAGSFQLLFIIFACALCIYDTCQE